MLFAIELQSSRVQVLSQTHAFIKPSKCFIRARNITLNDKQVIELGRYDQVKSLVLPLLRYGRKFRLACAMALYRPAGASRAEVLEAQAIFEDILCEDRRVLGPSHPDTLEVLVELDRASMTLEDLLRKS